MMTNDERKEVEERTRLELIIGNDTFRQTIIQKEVDAALQRWATGIGITSFVALGAILIGVFTTINSVTASTVKEQIVQNTKLLDGPIQTVMNSSMTQVIKMQHAMKDMEDKIAQANADLEKTRQAAADAQRRAMQDMEGQVAQAKAAVMKAQQTAADAQRRADNVSTAAKQAAGITEAEWTKIRSFLNYLKEHKRETDIEMTVAGLDHKMAALDDKVPVLDHRMAALDDKVPTLEKAIRASGDTLANLAKAITVSNGTVTLKTSGGSFIDLNDEQIVVKHVDGNYVDITKHAVRLQGPGNNFMLLGEGDVRISGPLYVNGRPINN
jgi:hypothetical protein